MRRPLAALLGAVALAVAALNGPPGPAAAQDQCTIALIPGLTTDAFYITMRKGAEMAAKAVGCELLFQGAPEFNPTLQVPVLQAVIARQPDAILIAPTDKQQLIAPLQQAVDAGIPVITVDTFIDDGKYQNGTGPGDFPLSYIATDNVLGGFLAGLALAKQIGEQGKVYVSNVKPGISTTDQREEGFKAAMRQLPGHHRARHPVQRQRRQQGGLAGPGGVRPQRRPRRRVRRQPVLGHRRRRRRQGAGQDRRDPRRRLRRADPDRRRPQVRPDRPRRGPAPGRDRLSTA